MKKLKVRVLSQELKDFVYELAKEKNQVIREKLFSKEDFNKLLDGIIAQDIGTILKTYDKEVRHAIKFFGKKLKAAAIKDGVNFSNKTINLERQKRFPLLGTGKIKCDYRQDIIS